MYVYIHIYMHIYILYNTSAQFNSSHVWNIPCVPPILEMKLNIKNSVLSLKSKEVITVQCQHGCLPFS
jgi:hypothetical protein